MLLLLLTLALLSIRVDLSYTRAEGWRFRLSTQSDTFKSMLAIFRLTGLRITSSTLDTTQEPPTIFGVGRGGERGTTPLSD